MSVVVFVCAFCVLGIYGHVPVRNQQFQIAWFAPIILIALCMIAKLFIRREWWNRRSLFHGRPLRLLILRAEILVNTMELPR